MKIGNPSQKSQYSTGLNLFSSSVLSSILIFFFHTASAQTPISGVVNTYYQVIDIVPAKACVRVTNAAGLNYNDKVMLVQMKGASINTSSNSSSFGDITRVNNAGNYEIGTVCTVIDDSVFLVFMLLNQYTSADKVQLVKIPQYISADVTDTLKAGPWNNTTGTGGVLAIIAEEDLILNAPIYTDSSGYRGGQYRLSTSDCGNTFIPPPATAYAYNANNLAPQNGAFKGEGIADVVASQSGGRGAPANGGGGGNNHNNAGAGGANLSAGGNGGGNSSSGGCTLNLRGLGGKALSNSGGTKIFMGGGGGAGQANNTVTVNPRGGGNGGGIVFISANNLIGNGNKISANGQSGGSAIGDGAGGGGAAGTVILNINNYIGTASIEAVGGAGGSVNDQATAGRCYGGGGGGSGGAIYFAGSVPGITSSVNGGAGGAETSRSGTCNPAVPGIAGTGGQIIPNYTYSSSLVLKSSYCALLLPVELIWFKAIFKNEHVKLTWEIAQPETADRFIVERSGDGRNWIAISQQFATDYISLYHGTDLSPQPKMNYYRLKMVDKTNMVNYSSVLKVYIPTRNDLIKIYPNPANKKIYLTGALPALTEISLFDLSGKLLITKKTFTNQNSMEMNLPDLPAGVYIIKIGDIVKRLIIR
ncbi:MAG: T9SS type A sorting domain-containing protein [Chitinophagaceae bacterium]